eukprot:1156477-Pelagomonas_calceolata.AAC.3
MSGLRLTDEGTAACSHLGAARQAKGRTGESMLMLTDKHNFPVAIDEQLEAWPDWAAILES